MFLSHLKLIFCDISCFLTCMLHSDILELMTKKTSLLDKIRKDHFYFREREF